MLYLGEPDNTGHFYGPDSEQVKYVVSGLDYVFGYLFKQLIRKGFDMKENLDLIVLTDHGMAKIGQTKFIYLSDYFNTKEFFVLERCSRGSLAELWLRDENSHLDQVFEILSSIQLLNEIKIKHVYRRDEIPERFRIKSNSRMASIIVIAHRGYQIIVDRDQTENDNIHKYNGNHGFDIDDESMRGIFIAKGKSFKENYYLNEAVHVIDVYELMSHLLHLNPKPNNGCFLRIQKVLKTNKLLSETKKCLIITLVLLTTSGWLVILRKIAANRKLK